MSVADPHGHLMLQGPLVDANHWHTDLCCAIGALLALQRKVLFACGFGGFVKPLRFYYRCNYLYAWNFKRTLFSAQPGFSLIRAFFNMLEHFLAKRTLFMQSRPKGLIYSQEPLRFKLLVPPCLILSAPCCFWAVDA